MLIIYHQSSKFEILRKYSLVDFGDRMRYMISHNQYLFQLIRFLILLFLKLLKLFLKKQFAILKIQDYCCYYYYKIFYQFGYIFTSFFVSSNLINTSMMQNLQDDTSFTKKYDMFTLRC